MAGSTLIDRNILKTFVPPGTLNAENFQELASKSEVEELPAGKIIFRQGETDRRTIYLLEGEVELSAANGQKAVLKSGTEMARHPLVNFQPRKHTAITKTRARITRIDSDLLDVLLTWDQMSGIEVDEIADEEHQEAADSDWMTRILQSKAFLQLPPANIQAMFMRMREIPVQLGETIIKQGDEGDYYYIIKSGKCKVTRSAKADTTELTLATLHDGDAFGEEALLSEAKRNANIVMVSDGVLMRLSKEDFNALLKEPMLNWVSSEEADALVARGAIWVDVRLESEHKTTGLKGSLNIPLFMLRMKADSLDPNREYILYCDSGRRSSAAAFLLSERGIKAYCLKGGLHEHRGD